VITTLIVQAATEYARYNPDIFYTFAIDGFLKEVNASLFMTYPVTNWTFEGIYDSIMEGAASSTQIHLPIPFDRFGWFYPVKPFRRKWPKPLLLFANFLGVL
jgi:hypothetical protein